MLKGIRLRATSWLGASVRVAVSRPLQNDDIDRAVLPGRNAFLARVRGTVRRHTHAWDNCPNIFRAADSDFCEAR